MKLFFLVNSPMMEGNRNDSAYELIDMSEVSVGGSTGAGVHGAVSIAAGVAVTGKTISNLYAPSKNASCTLIVWLLFYCCDLY